MKVAELTQWRAVRLPSGKIHRLRFGYGRGFDAFSRAARTDCGMRIGNTGYDQFTPKQCEAVPDGTALEAELCGNCYPRWRLSTVAVVTLLAPSERHA